MKKHEELSPERAVKYVMNLREIMLNLSQDNLECIKAVDTLIDHFCLLMGPKVFFDHFLGKKEKNEEPK